MASIGDIKIRISADPGGLEKALKTAEYKLKRFSRITGEIGSNLLRNVTLPIVGLGAAAIKTAGDFEQLTNGLTSIMGDSELAKAEIEKLRTEAMKPGLDLTQAVKGSVRLQSVGLSADIARKALTNFGNAIALAGGTSSDLDGVTLALTQIVSKGKISAEEINQLAERVPQVRKAIETAFGTGDSEALQKLGISAEEFVYKVTEEMGKLPKAVGGINNSLNNAGQAVTQFLVTVGNDIEKSFNISGKVAQFSDWLNELAGRFARLEDGTKKLVLKTLAFVAAVGPAIKVVSIFSSTIANTAGLARLFISNLRGLAVGIVSAAQKFAAMDKVMKATTIGLLVAGIAAATLAYQAWSKQISIAQKVHNTLNDVNIEAAKNIAAEKIQIEKLKNVLNDETAAREDKVKALKELQSISPEYFKGLSFEKSSIDDINTSLDGYISRIEKRARLQAANEKLVAIEKELLDVAQQAEQAAPGFFEQALEATKAAAFGTNASIELGKKYGQNIVENTKSLEAQKKALIDYINTAEKGIATPLASGNTPTFTRTDKKVEARAPEGGVNALERMAVNFKEITLKSNEAGTALDNFAARGGVLVDVQTRADEIKNIFADMNQQLTNIINSGISSAFVDLGDTIGGAIANAKNFGQAMGAIGGSVLNSLAGVLGEVGKLAIATGIAVEGIKAALQTLNPVVAIAAGVALVALSKAVPKLLAKKIPAFAEGVDNFSGGMALVGEVGPELVNLPRGSSVIPNNKLGGNGEQNIKVTGSIVARGSDLLVIIREEIKNQARLGL